MASSTTATTNAPPVRLPPSWDRGDTAQYLQRTANYAFNPEAYLLKHFGAEEFASRKEKGMLCIAPALPPGPSSSGQDSSPARFVDSDMYGGWSSHKDHFEAHIAKLLSKPYATFFLTGVMAQATALKVWSSSMYKNRTRVAWHRSSHLEIAEEAGVQQLWGLEREFLGKDPLALPTVEDVRELVELREESQRPAAILLEVPCRELGCITYTWSDLQTISDICRANNVALHLDGARLWDIEPYYQRTAGKNITDIAALFDSVYVSFYKGLRGTTGCMLGVPDAQFADEASIWRVRAGGNAFCSAWNIAENERAFNEAYGGFAAKTEMAIKIVKEVEEATTSPTTPSDPKSRQQRVLTFQPSPPLCPQFNILIHDFTEAEITSAAKHVEQTAGIKVLAGVRSYNHALGVVAGTRPFKGYRPKLHKPEPESELEEGSKTEGKTETELLAEERQWMYEFNIDPSNANVPVETFVRGFVELEKALRGLRK